MKGETNLSELLKGMTPKLNIGEYVFPTVKDINAINREDTLFEFKEPEGVNILMKRARADELQLSYEYVASWITLQIHSSLEAVGLTAVFSGELAKNNISCNVVAGYYHDHIFVDIKDTDKAIQVLRLLSEKHTSN